jgi:8-oxo-dGTP pyrophosphatase MutT (NUDIX family)
MAGEKPTYEVAITAIIVKDGKYLITRRSPNKKKFPGLWTVPGGRLEPTDYISFPKDTKYYWYNVLERTLAREVKEEVGLEINNLRYVTSLANIDKDGGPSSLVISCLADYASGEVVLQEEECDKYEWISLKEAPKYELIDGIHDELAMAENVLKTGRIGEWKRH